MSPNRDLLVNPQLYLVLTADWREVGGWKEFLMTGPWGRLAGFWAACSQAAFAYIGTEILGITAEETERCRETLPKAVQRISQRIWLYYVGTIFVLGLNVSSNDPELVWYTDNPKGTYQGPFILMAQRAGIPGLAHLLNAVTLLAAVSVGNANLYSTVAFYEKKINQ